MSTPARISRLLAAAALAAALATPAVRAQDARPVAFTNARILTLAGPPIERGTLVARNGRIVAVGADVAAPAGAIVVDCAGGTLMPGLVSAFSRAGLQQQRGVPVEADGGRRGGRRQRGGPVEVAPARSAQNKAATKVVEALDPKQDVFAELLSNGVTTLALTPQGNALPGLGAILRPDGKTLEQLTQDDDAFVFVGVARDGSTKKTLKESFEAAKKIVEARKKPKQEPKPEDSKPAEGEAKPGDKPAEPAKKDDKPEPKPEPKPEDRPKPDDKKPEEKKPEPPKEEKKDPNLEVLADLLEGKRRAVLQIDSAADLLHWYHAVGADLKFPRAVAVTRWDVNAGTFDRVVDDVKKLGATLLLPPELTVIPRTRYLIDPVDTLHRAGIEVGFVLGDNKATLRTLFFRLMELVRAGLPADVALRGVTVVPSKVLALDGEVGTLEAGKKANLLLFSGDPLDPTSELRTVWLEGKKIEPKSLQR